MLMDRVDPCQMNHTKRNLPPRPYNQHETSSRRRCPVSRAKPQWEHNLVQTHSQNGKNWEWLSPKHVGCLDASQNSQSIHKPFWTYRIWLRGTASTSNIEIVESIQSKALRIVVDAPWYVLNVVMWMDLQTQADKEEICHHISQYRVCLNALPDDLVVNLMARPDNDRQMWRHLLNDLHTILICSSSL
jgi:hypothetical protein